MTLTADEIQVLVTLKAETAAGARQAQSDLSSVHAAAQQLGQGLDYVPTKSAAAGQSLAQTGQSARSLTGDMASLAQQVVLLAAGRAGVQAAAAIGEELRQALFGALADGATEEQRAAALASMDQVLGALQQKGTEAGTLTAQSLGAAVDKGLQSLQLAQLVGPTITPVMEALSNAWHDGGEQNVAQAGQLVAGVQMKLSQLPEFARGQLGTEWKAALDDFLANPTEETFSNLAATAGRINTAFATIPASLRGMAPEVRYAWEQVGAAIAGGAKLSEEDIAGLKSAIGTIPTKLSELPASAWNAIHELERAFRAGEISAEDFESGLRSAVEKGKADLQQMTQAARELQQEMQRLAIAERDRNDRAAGFRPPPGSYGDRGTAPQQGAEHGTTAGFTHGGGLSGGEYSAAEMQAAGVTQQQPYRFDFSERYPYFGWEHVIPQMVADWTHVMGGAMAEPRRDWAAIKDEVARQTASAKDQTELLRIIATVLSGAFGTGGGFHSAVTNEVREANRRGELREVFPA
jgi:hypothetical protein